jgi:uncharacterized protein YcnI
MKARIALAAGAVTAALALPAAASAHVTVNPKTVAAGSFTVLGVRVPNERDHASTVKVVLRLPHGFTFLSYEPQPGWRVKLVKRHLAKPLTVFGEQVHSEFAKVVFRGTRKGLGKIRPGQFREFRLSTLVPGAAGDVLTFKALQTYSNGEVVRWTGKPGSDTPAPQVTLVAPATSASVRAHAAHAQVKRRTPRPGATAHRVKAVAIRFAESVLTGGITVSRGGRTLTPKASGFKGRDHAVLRAAFKRKLGTGTYTVRWHALADDGHHQQGSWRFTVS